MKSDLSKNCAPEVDSSEWHQQGMAAATSGDYSEAFRCFNQALESSDLTPLQKFDIGQFFLNTAQPWRAVQIFKSLYRESDMDTDISGPFAMALLEAGKYRESFRIAQKLYKQTGNQDWFFHMIVAVALARDMRTLFKLLNDQPALYQSVIQHLFSINAFEPAADIAKRTTELWPDEASTWNYFGVVNSGRDRGNEALSSYRNAIAIAPNDADFRFNLGNTLGSLGQTDEALDQYRVALKVSPKSIQVLRNFAEHI